MLANIIPYLLRKLKQDYGIISFMTNPNVEQLLEIVENANQNPEDPSTNRLLIAQHIAALGFYMIGTAESQTTRHPTKQTYRDRNFINENGEPFESTFFNDPDKKTTRATWSGKLALECAVLGDFNIRDQRMLLGKPLTRTPRMYGWEYRATVAADEHDEIVLYEDLVFPHAEQALLNNVDDSIEGFIDVVRPDGFHDIARLWDNPKTNRSEVILGYPGTVFHFGVVETIATLTVRGSDLWYTDINAREYDADPPRVTS